MSIHWLEVSATLLTIIFSSCVTLDATLAPFIPVATNSEYRHIYCVYEDQSNAGKLLACVLHSVQSFDIEGEIWNVIAGNSSEPPAYREGSAIEARFSYIRDLVQPDRRTFIVSDTGNQCLRIIKQNKTAPFSGHCSQDRSLVSNIFQYGRPWGLLLVGYSLYVTDQAKWNIRVLNIATGSTSILASFSAASGPNRFAFPKAMLCSLPSCQSFWLSYNNGLASVNRTDGTATQILGSMSFGNTTGTFNETRFGYIPAIEHLTDTNILAADYANNLIVGLDFDSELSEASLSLDRVWSMECSNGTMYFGTETGLYKSAIDGVLDEYRCPRAKLD